MQPLIEEPSGDPDWTDGEDLELTAYCAGETRLSIVPASLERAWMTETWRRGPYRCLPLVIANSAGWFVLNGASFTAVWDGSAGIGATKIMYDERDPAEHYPATSMFGHGILTFYIPFVVRTADGYNLLVRGPANMPKDAACALEGIVETDWAVATFTMSWQITRPNHPVRFEVGEPISMIVPQRRGELARFRPAVRAIADNHRLAAAHEAWRRSRANFRRGLNKDKLCAIRRSDNWQKHYFRGVTPTGERGKEHETRLHLRPFTQTAITPSREG